MAVKYRKLYFNSRDNELVSEQIFVLLYDIHESRPTGWNVNEGKRTWARQEELVREKGVWSPSNPTGAAAPSHNAPHIWTGRPDHALDLDGVTVVMQEARRRGVTLTQTILPNEPWHVVPDAEELAYFYKKNRRRVFRQIRINKLEDRVRKQIKTQTKKLRKLKAKLRRLKRRK